MSFDVFAQSFRNGTNAAADVAAARSVMSSVDYAHKPEFDSFYISFNDGSHLEMFAGGLKSDEEVFDGAMFAIRGMSQSVVDFIFKFCEASGCVMLPAMEPAYVLLASQDLANHLPSGIVNRFQQIVVKDGAELMAALCGGFKGWQAYRDQIAFTSKSTPQSQDIEPRN